LINIICLFGTLAAQSVYANKLKARWQIWAVPSGLLKTGATKEPYRGKSKVERGEVLGMQFQSDKRSYNPHFHLIVKSQEIADIFDKRMDGVLDTRLYQQVTGFKEYLFEPQLTVWIDNRTS
jgi:hypothetical protein